MGCTVVQCWFVCLADLSDSPQNVFGRISSTIVIFVSLVVVVFCASDMVTAMTTSLTFVGDGIQCDDLGSRNHKHMKGTCGLSVV